MAATLLLKSDVPSPTKEELSNSKFKIQNEEIP
jgi:hypothetical protein